jgi:hypothetical protein
VYTLRSDGEKTLQVMQMEKSLEIARNTRGDSGGKLAQTIIIPGKKSEGRERASSMLEGISLSKYPYESVSIEK